MRDYNEEQRAMLSSARSRKGFKISSFPKLHLGKLESGQVLTPLARCEEVARIYGLDVEEFRAFLVEARENREKFNETRRSLKKKGGQGKSIYEFTSGGIHKKTQTEAKKIGLGDWS